jgi:hypothetical protein
MALLDKKVKSQRQERKPNGEFKQRAPLPQKWWIHAEKRPALYSAITGSKRVLATNAQASPQYTVAFMQGGSVYANSLNIFPCDKFSAHSVLQSKVHEVFARSICSSLKDDLRYNPSDCFETFPFPTALLDSAAADLTHQSTRQNLEAIGERYHQFRAELMVKNNEGLTSTYNRFHDPSESSSGLLELRRLHGEMDQAVLAAYGWSDVATACGFGLDYLDLEEDAQLPDDLQERIDSGELFFWEPDEACAFEAQVRAYGAVKGKKKFPWRYRWPDDVRDDVLARLLALNAERYGEEVALGLHSKGAKQAAKASRAAGASGAAAKAGKRLGRPPKNSQPGETEPTQTKQMGLGL